MKFTTNRVNAGLLLRKIISKMDNIYKDKYGYFYYAGNYDDIENRHNYATLLSYRPQLTSVFKSNNWYNLYKSEMAVSNTLRFCFSIIVGCSCDDYPYDIIEYPKYKMIIRKYYIPLILDTRRLTDSIN